MKEILKIDLLEKRRIRQKEWITFKINYVIKNTNEIKLLDLNYNDINKLSERVFEDFEEQTSWQSYTTLLIADIKDEKKDKKEKKWL